MGLTKIPSRSVSTFIQPQLEANVTVILYSLIDWLKIGIYVYIQDAGVYEVVGIAGNVYTMKLKTMEATQGATISAGVLFPVEYTGANDWGAKEW